MANKWYKYIVALMVCCCCAGALRAQDDSTEVQQDSAAVINYGDEQDTTDEATYTQALTKFSIKDSLPGLVTERHLPASTSKELKKDKDYWYADKAAGKEKEEDTEIKKGFWYYFFKLITSPVFYYIFWAVIIGAFVLLIVTYLKTFTSNTKKIRNMGEVDVQQDEGNIFALNFDELINQALNGQNYRLATRLLFLKVLRSLSEKNIISYGIDKTNMDYLFELSNTKYSKDFMLVSRTYEYVWYGNFKVEQSQFMHIKRLLDDINKKIVN